LLADASPANAKVGQRTLAALKQPGAEVVVPAIWPLEIANVLARSEGKGLVNESQIAAFTGLLKRLPIVVDLESAAQSLERTLELARRHRLSAYDAAYLELALRLRVPLTTFDAELKRVASRTGVDLFPS